MTPFHSLLEYKRCQLFARSNYIICAVHPEGIKGNSCIDFRPDPDVVHDLWVPIGYCWYGNDLIPNVPSKLTQGDRETLLQSHPLFTGRCPWCGHQFTEDPEVHWDCPECHWKNDSVV